MKKAEVNITREVRTFWDLFHGADVLLEKSQQDKEGSYYTNMASLIFSAFSFEAYLNHLGESKIKHWEEIEKISILSKYKVLCTEFDIKTDFGRRPYQTLGRLFQFRNSIAHGKSKVITITKEVNADTEIKEHTPKTKWEEYCTEENAKIAYDDIEKIIKELSLVSKDSKYPFRGGLIQGSMQIK